MRKSDEAVKSRFLNKDKEKKIMRVLSRMPCQAYLFVKKKE